MAGITPVHLIIVLVIALLILGPGKLPETGAALGKAMREFRGAMKDDVAPIVQTSPSDAATPDAAPPTNPPSSPA
jgi:sec-independent protein translocase protein TatA